MNIPEETLQRLINFAHAAMEKRPAIDDGFVVTQSRHPSGNAVLLAKDMRALQSLGNPSWCIVSELQSKFGWSESDIEIGAAEFTSGEYYACITEDGEGNSVGVYRKHGCEYIGYIEVMSASQVHNDFISGKWVSDK